MTYAAWHETRFGIPYDADSRSDGEHVLGILESIFYALIDLILDLRIRPSADR